MLECFFNKRDPTQVLLSCEICEIFKNTFLLRDTSHGCFCFMTMNIEAIRCFVKELFPRVLESLMSMGNLVEGISFPRIPLKWEFYICSFDKLDNTVELADIVENCFCNCNEKGMHTTVSVDCCFFQAIWFLWVNSYKLII